MNRFDSMIRLEHTNIHPKQLDRIQIITVNQWMNAIDRSPTINAKMTPFHSSSLPTYCICEPICEWFKSSLLDDDYWFPASWSVAVVVSLFFGTLCATNSSMLGSCHVSWSIEFSWMVNFGLLADRPTDTHTNEKEEIQSSYSTWLYVMSPVTWSIYCTATSTSNSSSL